MISETLPTTKRMVVQAMITAENRNVSPTPLRKNKKLYSYTLLAAQQLKQNC